MHPNSFIVLSREGTTWRLLFQCPVGDHTRRGVSRAHMLAFDRLYGLARLATLLDKPIHS